MQKTTAMAKGKPGALVVAVEIEPADKVRSRAHGIAGKGAEGKWLRFRDDFLKRSVADQIRVIRGGTRAQNLVVLAEAVQVSQEAVFRAVGLPVSTAKRKVSKDEMLDSATTERLIRICRIEKLAEDVFGDGADARKWLRTENMGLGATPLSMLDTDLGAQEVARVLNAIAYGGAA